MLNTDQEAIERKVEMMNKNRNIFIKTKGCAKKKTKQETRPHRCHSLRSYHQNYGGAPLKQHMKFSRFTW
jgi:hypothetical protein